MKHVWIHKFGLPVCKLCGYVRRAEGPQSKCKGPVRAVLRQNRIARDYGAPTDPINGRNRGGEG